MNAPPEMMLWRGLQSAGAWNENTKHRSGVRNDVSNEAIQNLRFEAADLLYPAPQNGGSGKSGA